MELNLNISQCSGDLVTLNDMHSNTISGHIGMKLTIVGPDFIVGTLPVDQRTVQPFGLLHGGASIVLAETLGSLASYFLVSHIKGVKVAGVEVSGSHLRPLTSGKATGVCRPLRIGRTMHFWKIAISDDRGRLCCDARLTVHVSRPEAPGE